MAELTLRRVSPTRSSRADAPRLGETLGVADELGQVDLAARLTAHADVARALLGALLDLPREHIVEDEQQSTQLGRRLCRPVEDGVHEGGGGRIEHERRMGAEEEAEGLEGDETDRRGAAIVVLCDETLEDAVEEGRARRGDGEDAVLQDDVVRLSVAEGVEAGVLDEERDHPAEHAEGTKRLVLARRRGGDERRGRGGRGEDDDGRDKLGRLGDPSIVEEFDRRTEPKLVDPLRLEDDAVARDELGQRLSLVSLDWSRAHAPRAGPAAS